MRLFSRPSRRPTPPLSFCLRSLSLRRARGASLQSSLPAQVLGPESLPGRLLLRHRRSRILPTRDVTEARALNGPRQGPAAHRAPPRLRATDAIVGELCARRPAAEAARCRRAAVSRAGPVEGRFVARTKARADAFRLSAKPWIGQLSFADHGGTEGWAADAPGESAVASERLPPTRGRPRSTPRGSRAAPPGWRGPARTRTGSGSAPRNAPSGRSGCRARTAPRRR